MIVGHIGGSSEAYSVPKSLRLRSEASARITRAYTNAVLDTNDKIKTYSLWVRLGDLGGVGFIVGNGNTANNYWGLLFNSNTLNLVGRISDVTVLNKMSTRLFRDPSRPYHIHLKVDTTQAVAEDRFILTVDGERLTSFSTNVIAAQNSLVAGFIAPSAGTWTFAIGCRSYSAVDFLGGTVSEIHVVDGSTVDADQFGEFNSYGQWVPKAYNGTHGVNGFYLPFNDGTNLTELCRDRSGNGKDFTATGVSLTAGTTYDWLEDTPTNVFAALNPLNNNYSGSSALFDANLYFYNNDATVRGVTGTLSLGSGKYYWEVTPTFTGGQYGFFAAVLSSTEVTAGMRSDGTLTGATGTPATYGVGDVVGVAVDAAAGTITIYKNGTLLTTLTAAVSIVDCFPWLSDGTASVVQIGAGINFGQRPFAYTPPTGYKALCTANMPEPTGAADNPKAHMAVATYVGDGAFQSIPLDADGDPFEFNAGLVWVKSRASTTSHILSGQIVDNQGYLVSHSTAAAVTPSSAPYMAGNELAVDATLGGTNVNLASYVAWLVKMGNSFVANTDGSISSQVSANTVGGMSIVEYTGTGANATVGHGLGAAPKLVIIKRLDGVSGWQVGHDAAGWTKYLRLDLTDAAATNATAWNNTAPTSSVFSLGSGTIANTSGASYIAICFAEVPGFSKIGSYTGNGSADGPFVNLGFKPRFLLLKKSSNVSDWRIFDSARDGYNPDNDALKANTNEVEETLDLIDFTANGFKIRSSLDAVNTSAGTYVFLAVPEQTFKRTNAQ